MTPSIPGDALANGSIPAVPGRAGPPTGTNSIGSPDDPSATILCANGPAELPSESEKLAGAQLEAAEHQYLPCEKCIPDLPEWRADVIRLKAK